MSSKGKRCFSGSTHAAISGPLSQTFGHLEWGATQQFVIPMDAYQKDDEVVVNFGLAGVHLKSIALAAERTFLIATGARYRRVDVTRLE
jgi:HSP20 family molecular chaperone IbpA